jgi:hypothetical protein
MVQEETLVASATGRVFSAWPEGLQMWPIASMPRMDRHVG